MSLGVLGAEPGPSPGWPTTGDPPRPCMPPACPGPPPPPPFTYVGRAPFDNYIRVGIAPWGQFPLGPAYEYPREAASCPTCTGAPNTLAVGSIIQASRALDRGQYQAAVVDALNAFGQACGPCQIAAGGGCQMCPSGSDLPECSGCVDGQPTGKSVFDHPLMGPVVVSVASAVATAIVLTFLARRKVPVQ